MSQFKPLNFSAGSRLGPYEIVAPLGAGGMGAVYRARDTKLDRQVALKVLPDEFIADPDRVARFQREAKTLASLNHPNIGSIYGLEEAAGVTALVLELVEGPTLADLIAGAGAGPRALSIENALPIARQIAEALEAAHEHGIIHGDLKPANVKVRDDGVVKVLDFGLAKALEGESSGVDVSQSPTLSVAATRAGVILGTAAYMAPEQARGKAVDKRADIWAFGCLLYEVLTGRRAFGGDDLTDTLAFIITKEPDWSALPSDCPGAIRTLLKRCLEKDRRKRIADVSTVLFVVDETPGLAQGPVEIGYSHKATGTRPLWRGAALVGAAALLLGAVIAGGTVWVFTRPVPPRVTRTTITLPEAASLRIDGADRDLCITPDGTRVVYTGGAVGGTQIFVRSLDALEPSALVAPIVSRITGGGAQGLFTSPDSQWVGYVDNNSILKKVAITGGPPVTLLTMDGNSRGVTWAADDTIVFATSQNATGLQSVRAGGGSAIVLTGPDRNRGEADHLFPEALPGGRSVLFTITAVEGGLDAAQIAVLDLTSGAYKTVAGGGSHAHYVDTGHLVYAAGGTLRAIAFDLDRLEARGTPVPVLPRLLTMVTCRRSPETA